MKLVFPTAGMKWADLITELRNVAFEQLMRNPERSVFLTYDASVAGKPGALRISMESGIKIPAHYDRDQLYRWIDQQAKRWPIL